MTSNAYISDIAKKSHKNNKIIEDKKFKVFFQKFEGKVYDPTLNKTLNILKQNEEQLKKEIQKRNNNIALLKSEVSLKNFNNNQKLEKEIKKIEEKIKILEKENRISMEKLEEIKIRRNETQYQFEKELGIIDNNKKVQLNKFIQELNNKEKSELIEDKIKKLQEESKKSQLKMQADLEKAIDKKNCDIDRMEKEKEEKIMKYKNDMRDNERKDIKERNLKAKEEILKLKELINKKPKYVSHLYRIFEDNFNKIQEMEIKNANLKRKELMRHISLKEFEEMSKNYNELKSKQIIESNLKKIREKEIWSQRKKLIPEYVSPMTKLIEEEKSKMKEIEKKEALERKKYKDLQNSYKAPKPLINKKEKKENNDKEKKTKKGIIKSSSYSDILRQKIMIKINTSKNKKEKQEEDKNTNQENDKNIINFKLPLINIKEKYRKINKSFEKDKINNNHEITTDYLNQRRLINEKNKEKKRNMGELSNMDYSKTNDIRKLIKENGINENMLKIAKSKLETLEEKKNQKSLLLKLNGGIANKPELGEEICDLMIDSIQARLSIIKEFEKLEENNNQNNINFEE